MFSIFKQVENESWELIEVASELSAVILRLEELRLDGSIYRAEKHTNSGDEVLDV